MSLQKTDLYQPKLFTSGHAIEEKEYLTNLNALEEQRKLAISNNKQEWLTIKQELLNVKNIILEIIDNPLSYPDLKNRKAIHNHKLISPFQILREAIDSSSSNSNMLESQSIREALIRFTCSEFFPSDTKLSQQNNSYFKGRDDDDLSKEQSNDIQAAFKTHIRTLDLITNQYKNLLNRATKIAPQIHKTVEEEKKEHRYSKAKSSLKDAFICALSLAYKKIPRNNNISLGAIRGSVDTLRIKTQNDEIQWEKTHSRETLTEKHVLEEHLKAYEHYNPNDPETIEYRAVVQALITAHSHNLQLIENVHFINKQWDAVNQPLTAATQSYADALKALQDALDTTSNTDQTTIRYFVNAIQQCIIQKHQGLDLSEPTSSTSKETLNDLTSILIHLNAILDNKHSIEHVTYYETIGKKMIATSKYKKLGQLLLGLGGVLLIAASIALGLFSGGALLQLGMYGTTVGAALVGSAITAGAVTLAGGGMMFWSNKQTTETLDIAYQSTLEKCIVPLL